MFEEIRKKLNIAGNILTANTHETVVTSLESDLERSNYDLATSVGKDFDQLEEYYKNLPITSIEREEVIWIICAFMRSTEINGHIKDLQSTQIGNLRNINKGYEEGIKTLKGKVSEGEGLENEKALFNLMQKERDDWKLKAEKNKRDEEEYKTLLEEYTELGEQLEEKEEKINELNSSWESQAKESNELAKGLETQTNLLNSMKTDRDNWRLKAEESGSSNVALDFSETLRNLETENDSLKGNVEELESKVSFLEEEIDRLSIRETDLEEKLDRKEEETNGVNTVNLLVTQKIQIQRLRFEKSLLHQHIEIER